MEGNLSMNVIMDWDMEADRDRTKEYIVDGKLWIIKTEDPYGFAKISLPVGGATPKKLSGKYTTYEEAVRAIDGYSRLKLAEKGKDHGKTSSRQVKEKSKKEKDKEEIKEVVNVDISIGI